MTTGDASADRLSEVVAGLLATRTLPPREALVLGQRDFFPTDHVQHLHEIFSMDPVAYPRRQGSGARRPGRAGDVQHRHRRRQHRRRQGPDAEIIVAAAAGPSWALVREPETAGGQTSQPGVVPNGVARPARERDAAALDQISAWLAKRLVADDG